MKNRTQKELYNREFKLKFFGYGDWLDEPDYVRFEYRGIICIIRRVCTREPNAINEAYFGGHLCGYLLLPNDHPLYGKQAGEIDLNCWGGITWSEETEQGWTIGFDCGHSGDIVPTLEIFRNSDPEYIELKKKFPIPEEFKQYSLFNPKYRTIDFCIKECKSLAKQVAKLKVKVSE